MTSHSENRDERDLSRFQTDPQSVGGRPTLVPSTGEKLSPGSLLVTRAALRRSRGVSTRTFGPFPLCVAHLRFQLFRISNAFYHISIINFMASLGFFFLDCLSGKRINLNTSSFPLGKCCYTGNICGLLVNLWAEKKPKQTKKKTTHTKNQTTPRAILTAQESIFCTNVEYSCKEVTECVLFYYLYNYYYYSE